MRKTKFNPHWFCYFDSERIGSGWRLAEVKHFGYKWVFVRTVDIESSRIARKVWDGILKCPVVKGKILFEEKAYHQGVQRWGEEAQPARPGGHSRKGKATSAAKPGADAEEA